MFEIGLTLGWAALMILLLCIRADIRELSALMKENRRELLKNSFGGRTSESYPNFQDEARLEAKNENKEEPKQTSSLNKSEEQLLKKF